MNRKDIVWLLFGSKIQAFKEIIESNYKIRTTHPVARNKSTDPTNKNFGESKCFKRCNELLAMEKIAPINFDLT